MTTICHSLERADLKQIVQIQRKRLRRLLAERKIELQVSDAAKELPICEGHDPAYGMRPLKRVLRQGIQDPLASQVLQGTVCEGGPGCDRRSRRRADPDGGEGSI